MRALLEAGANPDAVDKSSMESPFDVANNEESRDLLVRWINHYCVMFVMLNMMQTSWDRSRTESLLEKRKAEMLASAEARIRTSAEREEFAKQKLRSEAVEFASKGDLAGLKNLLMMSADEAEKTSTRPRFVLRKSHCTIACLTQVAW